MLSVSRILIILYAPHYITSIIFINDVAVSSPVAAESVEAETMLRKSQRAWPALHHIIGVERKGFFVFSLSASFFGLFDGQVAARSVTLNSFPCSNIAA
jgi:hypothetical protein